MSLQLILLIILTHVLPFLMALAILTIAKEGHQSIYINLLSLRGKPYKVPWHIENIIITVLPELVQGGGTDIENV